MGWVPLEPYLLFDCQNCQCVLYLHPLFREYIDIVCKKQTKREFLEEKKNNFKYPEKERNNAIQNNWAYEQTSKQSNWERRNKNGSTI